MNTTENTIMDIDFAMDQVKPETKETTKKASKKAATKKEVKEPASKKNSTKKEEKKPVTKKEAKTPATKEKATKGKKKPLVFDSVTPAAQYLTDLLGLKITNSKDCLYKALRGNGQTHNFSVTKNEDNKIVLTPLA